MAGLEARVARGLPVDRIASVASLLVSCIDVLGIANAKLGADTIDTMPPATLAAMRDHGQLVDDGLAPFSSWYDAVLAAIETKCCTLGLR